MLKIVQVFDDKFIAGADTLFQKIPCEAKQKESILWMWTVLNASC